MVVDISRITGERQDLQGGWCSGINTASPLLHFDISIHPHRLFATPSPMNQMLVVPAPARIAVPNLTALHYRHSQIRKVVHVPFHIARGSRFVVVEGHMCGYGAVPIKRTAIQLVVQGVVSRFLVFTRRGPSMPENEALATLSGGIRWRGDILVVRRGRREGYEYINIGSGRALDEVDLAIRL